MNKITFPRRGVDGHLHQRAEIEDFFIQEVESDIRGRLVNLFPLCYANQIPILDAIISNLHSLLLMPPTNMEAVIGQWNSSSNPAILKTKCKKNIAKNEKTEKTFGKKIFNAFGYEDYRGSVLVELAEYLNVKTCPYCNNYYTLYLSKDKGTKVKALFQFDHFYDKGAYPMFSMSLYNLIPSCSVCNHSKGSDTLPSIFNPYESNLSSLFTYHVKNDLDFYQGKATKCEMELIQSGKANPIDFDVYQNFTHLKAQSERHVDLIEEIYTRSYLFHYYGISQNFAGLPSIQARLAHGTYMKPEEIGERPLTKLYQDIWEQANTGTLNRQP